MGKWDKDEQTNKQKKEIDHQSISPALFAVLREIIFRLFRTQAWTVPRSVTAGITGKSLLYTGDNQEGDANDDCLKQLSRDICSGILMILMPYSTQSPRRVSFCWISWTKSKCRFFLYLVLVHLLCRNIPAAIRPTHGHWATFERGGGGRERKKRRNAAIIKCASNMTVTLLSCAPARQVLHYIQVAEHRCNPSPNKQTNKHTECIS